MKDTFKKIGKEWGGVATIVGTIVITGFSSYNCQKNDMRYALSEHQKNIDKLLERDKQSIENLLEAKLDPINNQLNNHIPTAINNLTERIDRLYEDPPPKKK